MMNYARQVTLETVKGLTVTELDYLHDEESNSIGALLLHIASTDFYYQKKSFEERELTEEEDKKWEAASYLGDTGREKIKGNDLKYYIDILTEERQIIYELLKEKDDEWLYKERELWGKIANHYFMWFHTFEDEIHHRGQINWLKKRLKNIS
ncbi:MAG: DUF664 domain-containing protein [Bacteroidota bacterium]|nr:DUF664 domain-containing protein [Bacteroidota bacterium]